MDSSRIVDIEEQLSSEMESLSVTGSAATASSATSSVATNESFDFSGPSGRHLSQSTGNINDENRRPAPSGFMSQSTGNLETVDHMLGRPNAEDDVFGSEEHTPRLADARPAMLRATSNSTMRSTSTTATRRYAALEQYRNEAATAERVAPFLADPSRARELVAQGKVGGWTAPTPLQERRDASTNARPEGNWTTSAQGVSTPRNGSYHGGQGFSGGSRHGTMGRHSYQALGQNRMTPTHSSTGTVERRSPRYVPANRNSQHGSQSAPRRQISGGNQMQVARRSSMNVALRGDNQIVLMEIARRNGDGTIDAQSRYHPDACIFVANLLGTASDEALEAAVTRVFSRYGVCFVKVRRDGTKSMPVAFCQFTVIEHARNALGNAQGALIFDRPCRVEPARTNSRWFMIHRRDRGRVSAHHIRGIMGQYGDIAEILVLDERSCNELGITSGVRVRFHRLNQLTNINSAAGNHPEYHIDMLGEFRKHSKEEFALLYMKKYEAFRRSIFVGGLPSDAYEREIGRHFGRFDHPFAFVEYADALAVQEALDNHEDHPFRGLIPLRVERRDMKDDLPGAPRAQAPQAEPSRPARRVASWGNPLGRGSWRGPALPPIEGSVGSEGGTPPRPPQLLPPGRYYVDHEELARRMADPNVGRAPAYRHHGGTNDAAPGGPPNAPVVPPATPATPGNPPAYGAPAYEAPAHAPTPGMHAGYGAGFDTGYGHFYGGFYPAMHVDEATGQVVWDQAAHEEWLRHWAEQNGRNGS
ncbi:hypothetical protein OQA88_7345 [Cercophora sp. LCS_1]